MLYLKRIWVGIIVFKWSWVMLAVVSIAFFLPTNLIPCFFGILAFTLLFALIYTAGKWKMAHDEYLAQSSNNKL